MSTKRAVVLPVMLCLGITLLLNPVYLSPGNLDGRATEVTYELDTVETEGEARQALYESEATLLCGAGAERPCVLEREVAARGHVGVNGTLADRERGDPHERRNARYDLVQFEDGFYVPETNRTGNATVLTLREVSTMDALEHAAVPSDELSPDVSDAAETGSVRVVDERLSELERAYPIEHDGEIYRVESVRYDSTPDYGLLFARMLLFLAGIILISFAWMYRGE